MDTHYSVRSALAGALLATALCGGAYFVLAPSLRDAERRRAELSCQTRVRAAEIEALRSQLNALKARRPARSSSATESAVAGASAHTTADAAGPATSPTHHRARRRHARSAGATRDALASGDKGGGAALDGLLDDRDYDPLRGIGDSIAGSRAR